MPSDSATLKKFIVLRSRPTSKEEMYLPKSSSAHSRLKSPERLPIALTGPGTIQSNHLKEETTTTNALGSSVLSESVLLTLVLLCAGRQSYSA